MSRPIAEESRRMEQCIKALRERDPHLTYQQMVAMTGISRQSIAAICKRLGLPRSRVLTNRRRITKEIDDAIISRYQGMMTIDVIACEFGVSQETIYLVLRRNHISLRPPRSMANHGSWKGGRRIDEDGYVQIRVDSSHPYVSMARVGGEIAEHRLVMAQHLGRALTPGETVHHKDGDRSHNDLTNLQLRIKNHGAGASLRCKSCGSLDIEALEI